MLTEFSRVGQCLQRLWGKQSFLKHVATLAGGNAVAQVITIAVMPVLARLYEPSDFGVVGVIFSLCTLLLAVGSFRLEIALPLQRDESEAMNVFRLCLLATLLTTTLALVGVAVFGHTIARLFGISQYSYLLWTLPFTTLLGCLYQSLNYYASRKKNFREIAETRVAQAVAIGSLQTCGGVAKSGPLGLLVGQFVGQTVGITTLWKRNRIGSMPFKGHRIWSSMWATAKKHRDFAFFGVWSSLLNVISSQMPVMLLASLFGVPSAGQYSLGFRVLQAPLGLVGTAVGQVFLSDIARNNGEGLLLPKVEKLFRYLASLAFPTILPFTVAAPHLFSVLFGDSWREAGTFVLLLGPWLALVFVGSPLSNLPCALGHQKGELIFQLTLLVGRIGALTAGYAWGDIIVAIGLFGAFSFVCWLVYTLWLLGLVGISARSALVTMSRSLLPGLPVMGVSVIVAKLLPSSGGSSIAISLLNVIGMLITCFYLWKKNHSDYHGKLAPL